MGEVYDGLLRLSRYSAFFVNHTSGSGCVTQTEVVKKMKAYLDSGNYNVLGVVVLLADLVMASGL